MSERAAGANAYLWPSIRRAAIRKKISHKVLVYWCGVFTLALTSPLWEHMGYVAWRENKCNILCKSLYEKGKLNGA